MTAVEEKRNYYRRLGAIIIDRREPDMLMSRSIQICRTWRSHLAWHLYNTLGLRSGRP